MYWNLYLKKPIHHGWSQVHSCWEGKYSLEEEQSLGKLCKRGRSMMQKLKSFLKSWTSMIKWINTHKKTLCEEHVAHAFREFYSDLKEAKHHDLNLQQSLFLVKDVMNSW